MRPSLGVVAVVVALLTVVGAETGCKRKSGPSPEFERAHVAFAKLYAQKLDDAYVDPLITNILEDLAKVPPTSVDAPDAQVLLARIVDGKARMEKAAEDRHNASLQARKSSIAQPSNYADTPAPPDPDVTPDAGLPQPTAGMARGEFEKRFGGCFAPGEPIDIQGRGIRDSYRLKDISNCRERHPGYDKLIVLMEPTTVLGIIPASAMFQAYPDGGKVQPKGPDAGTSSSADAAVEGAPGAGDAGAYPPGTGIPGTNYGDSGY